MRQLIFAAIASVGLLGSMATHPAGAQALRPVGSPTVSPYLNLLRPGINPAINYYGSVRPQLQYNTAINTLQQQVAANRVAATAAENPEVTTGHPIYFLNYQRYFLNTGAVSPFQNVQASARALNAGALQTPYSAGGSTAGSRAISNITSGVTTPYRRY